MVLDPPEEGEEPYRPLFSKGDVISITFPDAGKDECFAVNRERDVGKERNNRLLSGSNKI